MRICDGVFSGLILAVSVVGCGGGSEAISEEEAAVNESVESQLQDSGVSAEEYEQQMEKEMQKSQN